MSGRRPALLVLRALGIGDLLTGVPALRGLRRAFPEHRLQLAAPAWLAPLARLVGGIDELVPQPGLVTLDWPWGAPDIAVNLHGRGPESHEVLAGLKPRRLLAFANAEAGFPDGPEWRADEHEVERWCRMLSAYDVHADPDDLRLRPPGASSAHRDVVVIHPGASTPLRRWSPARFTAVAAELHALGHRVVVTGGRDEERLAGSIAAGAGLPPSAVLAGRLSLLQLASLLASARLLVSSDTGVAHLATAVSTPSVTVFGPVTPAEWGPRIDRDKHRVLWLPDTSGDASRSLARITPSAVVREARRLLAAGTAGPVSAPSRPAATRPLSRTPAV